MKSNAKGKKLKATAKPSPLPWKDILTSLEEAVVVIDDRGRVSFLNQAAESLTGISALQIQGQTYQQVFKRNPWVVDMVEKSQLPQRSSTRGEGEFHTPPWNQRPVSLMVSPLQDPNGQRGGSILLLRDLTYQRQMEEQLKRSDRMALLGTLAAGLAHEIKNPLGGIKGASQLLKKEVPQQPSLMEYTDIIVREVHRIDALMEQLLDLCRPQKLHLIPLNIHEVLDHVLALEGQVLSGSHLQIKKNFDPSLPPVLGHRDRLIQVFLNLVKNAHQAIKGNGEITLTTRMETDYHIRGEGSLGDKFIRVTIADNGPGINEEQLSQIFSPFFTTKSNGTGLGLAICHRIIKEHGGYIGVETFEGEGAAFRVSLVVADQAL
ncbi:MAG: PAS domain S-box protein [Deltaproteobacteria bacterium]|nr:PAS domain S-box protein [Deltaproteobacteria bacterium]